MVDLLSYQVKESNMYGYIYLTTFLPTGKIYIGQKKKDYFDSSYYGSGKIIKSLVEKYDKQEFTVELIDTAESQEELNKKEIYWINYYDSTDISRGYNIALGGQGARVEHQTQETKDKISKANTGKLRSSKTKSQMCVDRAGSRWINNGKENKQIRRWDVNNYLFEGSEWKLGMLPGRINGPQSEQTRLKISEANRGKKHSEEWIENHRESLKKKKRHWYTNGIDNICIPEGNDIPEGFYLGRYVDEEFKKSCGIKNVGKTPWNKGKKLK